MPTNTGCSEHANVLCLVGMMCVLGRGEAKRAIGLVRADARARKHAEGHAPGERRGYGNGNELGNNEKVGWCARERWREKHRRQQCAHKRWQTVRTGGNYPWSATDRESWRRYGEYGDLSKNVNDDGANVGEGSEGMVSEEGGHITIREPE
jgi:hypothetical protein